MKRFSQWILTFGFVMFFLTMLPQLLLADPGDPNCDPLDPSCPIDGGLWLLLLIGAAYGVKKILDFRKVKTDTDPR